MAAQPGYYVRVVSWYSILRYPSDIGTALVFKYVHINHPRRPTPTHLWIFFGFDKPEPFVIATSKSPWALKENLRPLLGGISTRLPFKSPLRMFIRHREGLVLQIVYYFLLGADLPCTTMVAKLVRVTCFTYLVYALPWYCSFGQNKRPLSPVPN